MTPPCMRVNPPLRGRSSLPSGIDRNGIHRSDTTEVEDSSTRHTEWQRDAELIAQFLSTEEERYFVELCAHYKSRIRGLLYMLLNGVTDDILDVEQEIIIALWKSLPRFRFHSSFATYLYRLCRNVAYNYMRATRHRMTTSFNEHVHTRLNTGNTDGRDVADTMQQSVHIRMVRRTLHSLKPEDRLIIHLREFEKRSVEECARIFDCAIGTIKAKLHRAKKRLSRLLLEEYK